MRAFYFAEMSEWFKEHDWKSCVRLKRTGGSNPLLCAKSKSTLSRVLLLLRISVKRRGFEGGSRFARAKRFALCNLGINNFDGKGGN